MVMTLNQFLQLPEEKPALEYVDGAVVQKPWPGGKHARLQGELAARFNRPGRAVALPELQVTFGGRSLVPDVAVYRWARIPRDPDGTIANRFTTPPDIAVEIASPDQSVTQLMRKCVWFVENGSAVALLIDDQDQTVLLFRAGHPTRIIRGDEPIDVADVLPGLKLTAKQLFGALRIR